MLWINSKRTRWQATCSKSLLVMFIAQILLSAACISTASADVMSETTIVTSHCHNESMATDHMGEGSNIAACSHCDVPEMGLSAHATISVDMTPVLLAIIVLPEIEILSSSNRAILIEQRAPPHSFSLLHHTNQRILI